MSLPLISRKIPNQFTQGYQLSLFLSRPETRPEGRAPPSLQYGELHTYLFETPLQERQSHHSHVWLARPSDSQFNGRVVIKIITASQRSAVQVAAMKSVYKELPDLQGNGIPYLFAETTMETPWGENADVLAIEYIPKTFLEFTSELDTGEHKEFHDITKYAAMVREATEMLDTAHRKDIAHSDMRQCHALFDGKRMVLIDWANYLRVPVQGLPDMEDAYKFSDLWEVLLCFFQSEMHDEAIKKWIKLNEPSIVAKLGPFADSVLSPRSEEDEL
ncbi:hypothetical protein VNI00_018874 [Paramarasmius palmivorus]|uniref:Protein kinase domain-containing protein n=1 Tax=Paramarasmius palmivorus TaxID=297713 RepID=A0AAW0AUT0_9AGAR